MFGKAIGWSVVVSWPCGLCRPWPRGADRVGRGWVAGAVSAHLALPPQSRRCPGRQALSPAVCVGGAAGGAGKGCSPPTVAHVVSALFAVILGPVSRAPGTAVPSVRVSLRPGRWTAFSALLMRLSIFPCFQTFFSLCDLFTSWPILRGLLGRFTSQQMQPWCEQVHVACVA